MNETSAKLRQLETERAADANTLVALRYEVQELTAKLGDETQSLDRERELLVNGRDGVSSAQETCASLEARGQVSRAQ